MRKYNIHNQQPNYFTSSSQRREDSHSHSLDEENNFSYFHTILQNYMQTNQNIISPYAQSMDDHEDCQAHTCSSGMIISLFNIVSSQAHSLESLNKKVEEMLESNKELARKVKELEVENEMLKSNENRKEQPQIIIRKQAANEMKIEGESVNKQSLLKILFGQQKYEYILKLLEPFDQPLYRERNFNIHMELVDMNGQRVANSNKIPMSLALYTCENPPKFIEKNTSGQKMLKGFVDQSLILGVCNFEKVQIRQVTSHYRGGWIFLVAIPCMTPLGANKTDNFVDFTKIKPLVIDEVIVKAKKPKKKDDKKDESAEEAL